MGILSNNLTFTGSLGNLSAYTMRGHDGIILRSKGGASKSRIKNAPSFEPTRRLNREWKGVTQVAALIRAGLYALRPLADYNVSGPLNALVKKIQVLDRDNPAGQRSILLSQHPEFIGGFNFNRKSLFDSVIRQPVPAGLDRSTGIFDFRTPSLQPSVNFFPHPFYAYFRMVLTAAAVSDHIAFEDKKKGYTQKASFLPQYEALYTDWIQANKPRPGTDYQIQPLTKALPGPDMLLIAAGGIQYGVLAADGSIQPAPNAGAAKILLVV
jgi:hypothetical protein